MRLNLKIRIFAGMIRRFLIGLLVGYVRMGLSFYFRRMEIHGQENVPATGAVMIAANHQNSFLDAIIIAAAISRRLHFLVRADVFKKPLAAKILRGLNMMPVFRFRDGWQSLGKNSETFDEVVALFQRKEVLLLFPEGNHSLLRRLRPLSRGFTKPLAMALEKNPDQKIFLLPAGLNFSDHKAFRSDASVYFGPPIDVSSFVREGILDANALRLRLSDEMKKLVVHIEDIETYPQIETQLITDGADFTDPITTNDRIAGMFIPPNVISKNGKIRTSKWMDTVFRLLHYPVLMGWHQVRSKITDPVFTASLKFVYGIFAFPLYYLIIFSAIFIIAEPLPAFEVIMLMIFSVLMKK